MKAMSVWCTWYNNPNSPHTTLLFIGCGTETGHLHIHDVSLFTIVVQEDVP